MFHQLTHTSFVPLMETLMLFWGGLHFLRWALRAFGRSRRFRLRSFTRGDGSAFHTFTLDLISINYSTSALNATVTWLGVRFRWFWVVWFSFGVVYAVVASVAGVFLLIYSVIAWAAFYTDSQVEMARYQVIGQLVSKYLGGIEGTNHHGSNQMLNLMIPGITLPLSHLPLYVVSFLIAGILHELGHGIAGAAQGVPLMRFGVNLSLFYPSAYTELAQEKLNKASRISQLRIISGGVWHNLILALVAGAIYHSHSPSSLLLSTPLYMPSPCHAPAVKWIRPGSPLAEKIRPGSILLSLNDEPLTKIDDWNRLLSPKNGSSAPTKGHCIIKDQLKVSAKDCCSPTGKDVANKGCFIDILDKGSMGCFDTGDVMFSQKCSLEQPCGGFKEGVVPACVGLQDPNDDSETWSLISFVNPGPSQVETGKACSNPSQMTFYGRISSLAPSVHFEMRVPRFRWVPTLLPTMLDDLFMYMQAFSFALAIFNIIPVFYLDGHHLLSNVISLLRETNKGPDAYSLIESGWYDNTHQSRSSRRDAWAVVERSILIFTTALLLLAMLLSFVNLLL